jgi:hypothetical protein
MRSLLFLAAIAGALASLSGDLSLVLELGSGYKSSHIIRVHLLTSIFAESLRDVSEPEPATSESVNVSQNITAAVSTPEVNSTTNALSSELNDLLKRVEASAEKAEKKSLEARQLAVQAVEKEEWVRSLVLTSDFVQP